MYTSRINMIIVITWCPIFSCDLPVHVTRKLHTVTTSTINQSQPVSIILASVVVCYRHDCGFPTHKGRIKGLFMFHLHVLELSFNMHHTVHRFLLSGYMTSFHQCSSAKNPPALIYLNPEVIQKRKQFSINDCDHWEWLTTSGRREEGQSPKNADIHLSFRALTNIINSAS